MKSSSKNALVKSEDYINFFPIRTEQASPMKLLLLTIFYKCHLDGKGHLYLQATAIKTRTEYKHFLSHFSKRFAKRVGKHTKKKVSHLFENTIQ